jgi:hypothetical protein
MNYCHINCIKLSTDVQHCHHVDRYGTSIQHTQYVSDDLSPALDPIMTQPYDAIQNHLHANKCTHQGLRAGMSVSGIGEVWTTVHVSKLLTPTHPQFCILSIRRIFKTDLYVFAKCIALYICILAKMRFSTSPKRCVCGLYQIHN